MARRTPSSKKLDEVIEWISQRADAPTGVSTDEVARFAGVSTSAAIYRMNAAALQLGDLVKVTRPHPATKGRDTRWFRYQAHADLWAAGRPHGPVAEQRTPITTVCLPTNARPMAYRDGALDFRLCPSRRGDTLRFLDGCEMAA